MDSIQLICLIVSLFGPLFLWSLFSPPDAAMIVQAKWQAIPGFLQVYSNAWHSGRRVLDSHSVCFNCLLVNQSERSPAFYWRGLIYHQGWIGEVWSVSRRVLVVRTFLIERHVPYQILGHWALIVNHLKNHQIHLKSNSVLSIFIILWLFNLWKFLLPSQRTRFMLSKRITIFSTIISTLVCSLLRLPKAKTKFKYLYDSMSNKC